MDIKLSKKAQEDLAFWKKSGNRQVMSKITGLLADIASHPYTGIGKPEALCWDLAGCWSRRITNRHRLIYRIEEGTGLIEVIAMRYHYGY